jgi:hypothetical protein
MKSHMLGGTAVEQLSEQLQSVLAGGHGPARTPQATQSATFEVHWLGRTVPIRSDKVGSLSLSLLSLALSLSLSLSLSLFVSGAYSYQSVFTRQLRTAIMRAQTKECVQRTHANYE